MANITYKKRDELDRAINAKAIKAWVKRYSVKDARSSFVKTRRVGDSSTARSA